MLFYRYCLGRGAMFLGFALLSAAVGCSSQGTISGKVTYQGKPLPIGTVTFVSEQGGAAYAADIRDGEYKVTKVPPGPVKIAIRTPSDTSQLMTKMQPPAEVLQKAGKSPDDLAKRPDAPKPVPVPNKFRDPNTSGLTYTVKSGSQVHNIDIPGE